MVIRTVPFTENDSFVLFTCTFALIRDFCGFSPLLGTLVDLNQKNRMRTELLNSQNRSDLITVCVRLIPWHHVHAALSSCCFDGFLFECGDIWLRCVLICRQQWWRRRKSKSNKIIAILMCTKHFHACCKAWRIPCTNK